tara:strand:- start:9296 stop:9823 length:528 start_codon:yes stop_codon:yes gene_type:complete
MKQTLIVYVQDEPGVLNRVSSMIRKRNFNIDSLVAGRTDKPGITRMTIVLNEPDKTKQKIVVNNLKKLIDVYDVVDATDIDCHLREYALVKIKLVEGTDELKNFINSDVCRIVEQDDRTLIIELSGSEEKVEKIIKALGSYNVIELMRSGKMAMLSGNEESHQPDLRKSDPYWKY